MSCVRSARRARARGGSALLLGAALGLGLGLGLGSSGCRREDAPPPAVGKDAVAVAPARPVDAAPDAAGFTAPTETTRVANAAFAAALPPDDPVDFEEAERGLVARETDPTIVSPSGRQFRPEAFAFVEGEAPASVNPSLWRQAKLNGHHGLYRVTDGIYQVRGYDVSNMSWIRGRTGWIVVDPLSSVESATAAVALARKHLGDDPIVAVILTHSHVDHFQGVAAVLPPVPDGSKKAKGTSSPTAGASASVRIVAPARFVEEAASENVVAGMAMGRRAVYQFGFGLPDGVRGYVDSGLGKQPLTGTSSFATPTDVVDRTPQPMTIDGVSFVFQHAPDSEAPAELAFYLPEQKAWCGAELVNRTMHNLYTLRGTKVRDARKWSGYVDDAIQRFGDVEVVFMSHNWPVFGHDRVVGFLKGQRDTYRFIHDQTLRLANQGATPREIAETLELPPPLAKGFSNRGYYGTLRHNAKAVYQFYFGWYDANPANLDPLPPVELGRRYVKAIGGAKAVKAEARAAIEAGDYRWAATLLDHLVYAEEDGDAKLLLASVYDQLAYQAESGVWRSVYLSGANELRNGIGGPVLDARSASAILAEVPLDLFFTAMATRLDGAKAAAREPLTINFVFTDVGQTFVVNVENGVLHHWARAADPKAAATVHLTRGFFLRLVTGQVGLDDVLLSGELDLEGSRRELLALFGLLDPGSAGFPIVTP